MTIDLGASITYFNGVGPQRAQLLKEHMGIASIEDLLTCFPLRHVDRSRIYTTFELTPDMPHVQLMGRILSFAVEGLGRKRRLVANFTDGHGTVQLVWFNSIAYFQKLYKPGTQYVVFGRPTAFGGAYSIMHPEVEPADDFKPEAMGMRPYYSVPEKLKKRGLVSRNIQDLVRTALGKFAPGTIPETLPPHMVAAQGLMPRDEAVRAMHFPPDAQTLSRATYRMKFEELFYVQLNILRYAADRRQAYAGHVLGTVGEMFHEFYSHHLPFELTGAQKRVIREVRQDVLTGRQMNRLLQGDVGSGKTLVALMCMLLAVDNGLQACIMAPTEILAEQHLHTFRQMLGDMPVRVELLTGIVKGKRRKEVLAGLASGEVHILVGTHAVIESGVQFRRLGFVVIDEQHRFGVAQRARLWHKAADGIPPHVLVMTATPIPRTLAMTLYGDLDVSVIDELPPGRKPIRTIHQTDQRRSGLYQSMRRQLDIGRQIYVVFPLIEESEKIDLQNLEDGYSRLCQVFPDVPVGKVHGRMKPVDKDEQMRRFAGGETRILVSTTVIEVGVNVPNASVMVIENADRFGLAQLHQLRGRVGRGAEQSYCVLVTGQRLASDTRRRIEVMCQTTDGFVIAEEDMKLRGPGDLQGTRQSGMAIELKVSNLARDGQIVQQARDVARQVLDADPQGNAPANALMWQRLAQLKANDQDWSAIS